MKRKKVLLIICFAAICMISTPASAGMYTMDATTAAGMRQLSVSAGDIGNLYYVGYNPGDLADRVFGVYTSYGATMNLDVGFTGNLVDNGGGDSAIAQIGLVNLGATGGPTYLPLGLSGTFDGFKLPISNDDNNDTWRYQAYVTVGDTLTPTYVSGWSTLASGTETDLLVSFNSNIDFATVTGIGFNIEWQPSLNGGDLSDEYHTSVVPLPTAVLLGILGLGAVGIKLRRYA